MKGWIYLLKLVDNKWYVGSTRNLTTRIRAHKSKNGSAWTKKYPMIGNEPHWVDEYKNISDLEMHLKEEMITEKNMLQYGVDNVRGGSYIQIELFEEQITTLEIKFSHYKDISYDDTICTRCGRDSHTYEKCYAKSHISGNIIYD